MPAAVLRPWWRHPGAIIALLLHAGLFLGLFQLRFAEGEWHALDRSVPVHATTTEWFHAIVDAKGYRGLVIWFFDTHDEIRIYHRYGEVAVRGYDPKLPDDAAGQGQFRLYRDVPMEYQPGALFMFVPPALLARELHGYQTWFTIWCGVVYSATLLIGMRLLAGAGGVSPAQGNRTLWWSLLFLLCFGGVAAARFDHAVPFFCVLGAWIFRRADRAGSMRPFAACGAVIACGVMVKIVPGVLLPAVLLWLCVSTSPARWHPAVVVTLSFAATLLALHFAFAAHWGDGYLNSYTYHLKRGLQLETTYSGVLMAGHGFGSEIFTRQQFGACDLITALAEPAKAISPLLFLLLAAFVASRVWFARSATVLADREHTVLLLTIALLLAFMLTNKVFSPQYVLWVGPLVACAYGSRPALLLPAALLLLAAAETQLLFPHLYDGLMRLKPVSIALLNLRNATLFLIFVLLVGRLPRLMARCSK